jgi:hypothetical protein
LIDKGAGHASRGRLLAFFSIFSGPFLMKRLLAILAVVLLLAGLGTGCGGDKDKGVNKDKDRPVPAKK